MTNLEKFYPGKRLEDFRQFGSMWVRDPDVDEPANYLSCVECHACDFCDTDKEHKTCIDTFEAWAKMEANNG